LPPISVTKNDASEVFNLSLFKKGFIVTSRRAVSLEKTFKLRKTVIVLNE